MNNQGQIPEPDVRSILDQERDNSWSAFNCVRVGTVQSFDASKQTASVQLVDPALVFNQGPQNGAVPQGPAVIPYPVLQEVPVFVLCGGTAFLGMPIAQGDTCVVLFNDRDIDLWQKNGTTGAAPNSLRMHSLADGIALVGIRPATNPVPNLPGDGQHVTLGNASGTFKQAMALLFSALTTGWVDTHGDVPGPATILAIQQAQTALNAIFQ